MLYTIATVGSINTSSLEKKNLASKSMEFNLKDKIFTTLFSDCLTVFTRNDEILKTKEKGMQKQLAARDKSSTGGGSSSSSSSGRTSDEDVKGDGIKKEEDVKGDVNSETAADKSMSEVAAGGDTSSEEASTSSSSSSSSSSVFSLAP
jgi:hypothetical protein